MRRILRRTGTSGAPAEAGRPPYTPLLTTLQEFARRYGMKFEEDRTERRWAGPQCILTGDISPDMSCFFYVSGGPGNLVVEALCWHAQSLKGRRRWTSQALNGSTALQGILREALDWADQMV